MPAAGEVAHWILADPHQLPKGQHGDRSMSEHGVRRLDAAGGAGGPYEVLGRGDLLRVTHPPEEIGASDSQEGDQTDDDTQKKGELLDARVCAVSPLRTN